MESAGLLGFGRYNHSWMCPGLMVTSPTVTFTGLSSCYHQEWKKNQESVLLCICLAKGLWSHRLLAPSQCWQRHPTLQGLLPRGPVWLSLLMSVIYSTSNSLCSTLCATQNLVAVSFSYLSSSQSPSLRYESLGLPQEPSLRTTGLYTT